MKFTFLTGAGASYGAGKIPNQPPLGNALFKELRKKYPRTWGNFPWEYAGPLSRNFEIGMQQIWQKRLNEVQKLMIEMACYFSEFNPSDDGSDCYSQIASKIAKEKLVKKIAFATLNYECILDIALCRSGLKIGYYHDPIPEDTIMIWKLHGACNLLPVLGLVNGTPTSTVVGGTIVAKNIYEGPVYAYDLPEVRNRYIKENFSLPPAMCVYMPGKPTQSAGEAINNMRNQWANWMLQSDVVFVIGVRPNLGERYVWQPIIDSRAIVWYVGGRDGEYDDLQKYLNYRLIYIKPTFSEAIDEILDYIGSTS